MLIDKKYVPRHEKAFAVCHWLNAFAFFMLFVTALPLYTDTFRFLYNIFGDKTLMYAHRVFGVMFILTPIIGFIIARKGYIIMLKEIFSFGKKDMEFMEKFPLELMGKDPHMPPQGFYNGGEKMNIALQLALSVVIVVTGLILWMGDSILPATITAYAIPVHSIAAAVCFAAALGHIYLAAGVNPDSLHGMTDGTIKASYADHHHGAWVNELISEGVVTRAEINEAEEAEKRHWGVSSPFRHPYERHGFACAEPCLFFPTRLWYHDRA